MPWNWPSPMPPDHLRPLGVHDELLVFHLVAAGDRSADPLSLAPGRVHLVPNSLGHDGPFEFGEGHQDAQEHPSR